ncbi:Cleavage stimulation factor subunit 2 [Galdieria sulphuraria]|uniref:mRNA splicing factor, putative isoform 1 n=1 Tax=Galdieria sulphuraria TaxID=130081 RepID=M2W4W6_GALSU|nr:mRNA splicing factor, putative isoform 1 [Galdieria sulphuraria]EME30781.1 mRNA splicing factor, putative isoform 1 [Galdieria sulphuraria]GJD10856.1 Cleavage stimulation factor subunit 2 [Galdieria sulphuraria]GJD12618.1 Cleavage stimulation factor subunit 2 [Galdieria sulphuraria]|eukprot:XP_005707301.1 mRNA splicing factor, putative isoform 1 [Galdieria sulphuraria]
MGRSTTVFVGNIAYNTSEEQLQEILSQIGPILSFRVVYDRETGKPKGYAFCEYPDAEMALSAIRNLNGTELNGRTLRVDLADSDKRELGQSAANMETGNNNPSTASNMKAGALNTSGGTGNIQGLSNLGAKGSLEQLSCQQIHEIMLQMKALAQQNPEQVRQLLLANPQLTYALLQGQIMLGLAPPTGWPSQSTPSSNANNSAGDLMNQTFYPSNVMAPSLSSGFAMGTSLPPNDMIQQAALLQNIINLTPAELESLPPEQRAQVLQLKATLGAQMGQPGLGSSAFSSNNN